MTLLGAISKDGEREELVAAVQRIVVAVDDSPPSACAVEWAAALAVRSRARLYVLNVAPSFGAPGGEKLSDEAKLDGLFALAEKRMQARVGERDAVIECVRIGRPAEQVASFACEKRADLIVAGTHDRGGVDRWLHPSIAGEILGRSRVPVLIVRERALSESGPQPLRRVLVAVDYSESSRAAVNLACTLAMVDGAAVDVYHVIDTSIARSAEVLSALESDDLRASLLAVAGANVRRWVESAIHDPDTRARVRTIVKIGKPVQVLSDAARSGYDLVACGSRGRGALARSLLGSTSEALIHAAPCPVLIAPARAPE